MVLAICRIELLTPVVKDIAVASETVLGEHDMEACDTVVTNQMVAESWHEQLQLTWIFFLYLYVS